MKQQVSAAADSYTAGVGTALITFIYSISEYVSMLGVLLGCILSSVLIYRGIIGAKKDALELKIKQKEFKNKQYERKNTNVPEENS